MALYYVFAGSDYYPCGGAADCKGIFDSLTDARRCLLKACGDWGSICTVEPDPERTGEFCFVVVEDKE